MLTSRDNYDPGSGPVVLFVKSRSFDVYTTDISEAQYVQLSMSLLLNCNNIPRDFTSLTITQGNNSHTVNVTVSDIDDGGTFNVGSIVTIRGNTNYSQDTPITITFNQ